MTPVTMIPTLLYNLFFITERAFGCPTWYYESNYTGGCVCGSELGESATSISIEFDEAVLNLVVLDSVQNESMIASRSFRIDFRTHGRPAATRSFRFYLAIIIISAQFHMPCIGLFVPRYSQN